MENIFYIIATEKPEWYVLCVKGTHYCLGASDNVDKLLGLVFKYVKTYKSVESVYEMLSTLSDKGKVGKNTFAQREEYYKEHRDDFKREIEEKISEAMQEVIAERKAKQPKFRAKRGIKRLKRKVAV